LSFWLRITYLDEARTSRKMKCHYTFDEHVGKVLIPGCIGVAVHGDLEYCTCRNGIESFEQFERKEFNDRMFEKDEHIRRLEKEVAYYNRQLKKVLEKRIGRKLR
jgi:hypothetical protein